MANLPRASVILDQDERLESSRVDAAVTHLGFQRVRGHDVGRAIAKELNLPVAVAELQVLERLQLWTEMPVPVRGPSFIDAAALIDGDLRMVEGAKLVEVPGIEGFVIAFEPRLDLRDLAWRG